MTRDRASPFNGEDGADFVRELIKSHDLQPLADALYAVPDEENQYVECGTAGRALVAAEILLAQQGNELGGIPDELYSWLREFGDPDPVLLGRASRAIRRVERDSELADLWKDSIHFHEWKGRIDTLLRRLGR